MLAGLPRRLPMLLPLTSDPLLRCLATGRLVRCSRVAGPLLVELRRRSERCVSPCCATSDGGVRHRASDRRPCPLMLPLSPFATCHLSCCRSDEDHHSPHRHLSPRQPSRKAPRPSPLRVTHRLRRFARLLPAISPLARHSDDHWSCGVCSRSRAAAAGGARSMHRHRASQGRPPSR